MASLFDIPTAIKENLVDIFGWSAFSIGNAVPPLTPVTTESSLASVYLFVTPSAPAPTTNQYIQLQVLQQGSGY